MHIINTSQILAELLPEVFYSLDPDQVFDTEDFPPKIKELISDMIMAAFFKKRVMDTIEREWLARLRSDFALGQFQTLDWKFVDIIDSDGTFVLITEEPQK